MQYILEERNGARVTIDAAMASIAKSARDENNRPMYNQILATDTVVIYKRNGAHVPLERAYKYGGRGNARSPVEYRGG